MKTATAIFFLAVTAYAGPLVLAVRTNRLFRCPAGDYVVPTAPDAKMTQRLWARKQSCEHCRWPWVAHGWQPVTNKTGKIIGATWSVDDRQIQQRTPTAATLRDIISSNNTATVKVGSDAVISNTVDVIRETP